MKHWSSPAITVRFFEDGEASPFVESQVPLDQLPDTFAVHTDLDIAGTQYVVVRAEPETKAEFSQMDRLDITVRRVETMPASDILFGLPSLCGAALPELTATRPPGEILGLHEDDWRQCELVAMQHADAIARELAAVRRIHEVDAVGVGFRNLHVRNAIESPLPPEIDWASVVGHLGATTALGGVAFGDHAIVNAKATRLDGGVVVWGVTGSSGLSALCVHDVRAATPTSAAALRRVADAFMLVIVDWCPCRAYVPGEGSLGGAVGLPWA